MKIHFKFFLFCIAFLIFSANLPVFAQNKRIVTFRYPFRHLIINNRIDPKLNRTDEERRFMDILIDPEKFNKPNLEMLFTYLSKRFPRPNTFFINVYTDSKDILNSKKGELQPISESKSSYTIKGDVAIFTRYNDERYFLIYLKDGDFDEVQMK
jgi:hypothetical protein